MPEAAQTATRARPIRAMPFPPPPPRGRKRRAASCAWRITSSRSGPRPKGPLPPPPRGGWPQGPLPGPLPWLLPFPPPEGGRGLPQGLGPPLLFHGMGRQVLPGLVASAIRSPPGEGQAPVPATRATAGARPASPGRESDRTETGECRSRGRHAKAPGPAGTPAAGGPADRRRPAPRLARDGSMGARAASREVPGFRGSGFKA